MLHGTWIFTYIWFKFTGKCRYAGKYSSPIRRIWDIQTLIAADPSCTSYVYIYIYTWNLFGTLLFWGLWTLQKKAFSNQKLRVIIWVLGINIYIYLYLYIYMISRKSLEESGGIYWEVSKIKRYDSIGWACFCGGSDFLQSYLEKGFLPPIGFLRLRLTFWDAVKNFQQKPRLVIFLGVGNIYSYLGDEQRPSGPWSFAVYGGLYYPCYTRLMISSWSPWLVGFFSEMLLPWDYIINGVSWFPL